MQIKNKPVFQKIMLYGAALASPITNQIPQGFLIGLLVLLKLWLPLQNIVFREKRVQSVWISYVTV